jgi:hypothetical protein
MKRLNPKYIQLIGDSIIPLLGYFFWNWNLYFILIFYGIDFLTKEVLLHLKSMKINDFRKGENSHWGKFALTSSLLLSFSIFLIQLSMPHIERNFDSLKELYAFWSLKDVGGLEQGYILIPLIIFIGYFQYKMEFLKPGIFAKMSIQDLWNPHIKSLLFILGFSAFSFGLVQFIQLPEVFFVVGIVLISSLIQLVSFTKKTS